MWSTAFNHHPTLGWVQDLWIGIATGDVTVIVATVLAVFMLVVLAVCAFQHHIANLVLNRLSVLEPSKSESRLEPAPRVSVLLPARNEQHNIKCCLDGLLAQDYPNFEVIVIDDRSTDGTAEIVQKYVRCDGRLRLIRNAKLPEGWTGKNHALHLGLEEAQGQYLLFVDADVWLHPRALSETVCVATREQIDMVSLAGNYHNVSFWEKTLNPIFVGLMTLCFQLWKVNDPNSKTAFAYGPYIFVRRDAYRKIGGHMAVRGSFIDDVMLGRAVKNAGFTLRVLRAPELVRIRLYRSLDEIRHGWLRICCGAMDHAPQLAWVELTAILTFVFAPWVVLSGATVAATFVGLTPALSVLLLASTLAILVQCSVVARLYRTTGGSWYYSFMLLPANLVVVGTWLAAMHKLQFGGRVLWRESHYASRNGSIPGNGESL